jgi:Helix-turn-helix domain
MQRSDVDTHIKPDARGATSAAEISRLVADAVAQALQVIQQQGRGNRDKDKQQPPKISYTIAQAVAASGVGRTSLYLAIRRGELRRLKRGARTLILDRDLRRWLEGLPPSNG